MTDEQLSRKELETFVDMVRDAELSEAVNLIKKVVPKVPKVSIELILKLGELRGSEGVLRSIRYGNPEEEEEECKSQQ
jgi:hypothetical protein